MCGGFENHDMEEPLISIILPVYNGEKYLNESIDSVLSQSYQNWELLIINDGSTDNTEELVLSFTDKRIRYLLNETNSGIIFSMNKGLDEAKGKFIARLDADDIALPHRLEKQVKFLTENEDYVLVGCYYHMIDSEGKYLGKVTYPANNLDAQTSLLLQNCFCHSAIMMRAGLAKELKYDPEFQVCEDYDLWYRISQRGKIINIPSFDALYRLHGGNISVNKKEIMFANVNKINKKLLDGLSIDYSEKELELHSNALCYNAGYFGNGSNLQLLENWMRKLYSHIKKNNHYNSLLFFRILSEKWIVAAYNSGHYGKLLFSRLLFLHPSVYFVNLYRKARRIF
jgi:glycosyltransferase involved in cell wall biosynthesis